MWMEVDTVDNFDTAPYVVHMTKSFGSSTVRTVRTVHQTYRFNIWTFSNAPTDGQKQASSSYASCFAHFEWPAAVISPISRATTEIETLG